MFKIAEDLQDLLEKRYDAKPVKIREGEASEITLPFSIDHIPAALAIFIKNELFDLDEELYTVYINKKKPGYSRASIYKIINGEYPLTKDIVDLITYYIFGISYAKAVAVSKLPNNLSQYKALKTEIENAVDKNKEEHSKKIKEPLKSILEEIAKLIAGEEYEQADKKIADAKKKFSNDKYSISHIKRLGTKLLHFRDGDYLQERQVLCECLSVFEEQNSIVDEREILLYLWDVCILLQDFDAAELYSNRYLDLIDESDLYNYSKAYIKFGHLKFCQYLFNTAFGVFDVASQMGKQLTLALEVTTKKNGFSILAGASYHKALVHKKLKNFGQAEIYLMQALQSYFQTSSFEYEAALVAYEQADIEIETNRISEKNWRTLLDRAKPIFFENKDHIYLAKCFRLESKVANVLADPEAELKHLTDAYKEVAKSKNKREVATYLTYLADYFLEQQDLDNAFFKYKEVIKFTQEEGLETENFQAAEQLSLMEVEPHRTNHLRHVMDL
ncbi:MAG: hypothetical protein JWQ38_348, partial [Flavipsychrobacter sp.]|nr:hypothetical protein [Flavipsychrobacter sp.]